MNPQQTPFNAYAELGLRPGASEAEVKAAWRRLVSQWHPDRNPSASAVARMQRINLALERIRAGGFDSEPEDGPDAAPAAAEPRPPKPPRRPAREEPPQPQADEPAPGRTIVRKLKLTLEEAAAGCTRVLRGRITATCGACSGLGHRVLAGACPSCHGSGAVRQAGWYGLFRSTAECEACRGSGQARQACAPCDGTGKLAPHSYRMSVRIPPGARDGDVLHVDARRSRGAQAPGAVDIHIELQRHPLFELDPDGTLRCTVPVDGFAWLGQRIVEVPTLGGMQPLRLRRDPLCHRLKGEGFPARGGATRGDLLVTIVPVFADRPSADQDILLDQLIATGLDPRGKPLEPRLAEWSQRLQASGRQGGPRRTNPRSEPR
jgi:molecular chaperone DnaJ